MQFRIERYFKKFSSAFLDFNSSVQNYIEYSNDMIPCKRLFATIPSWRLGADMKIKEKAQLLSQLPSPIIHLQCPQLA